MGTKLSAKTQLPTGKCEIYLTMPIECTYVAHGYCHRTRRAKCKHRKELAPMMEHIQKLRRRKANEDKES